MRTLHPLSDHSENIHVPFLILDLNTLEIKNSFIFKYNFTVLTLQK